MNNASRKRDASNPCNNKSTGRVILKPFAQAPQMNPNVSKITGVICGYRVEEIEDELMQKIRSLDKLIDELAKGKTMEKILRK
jgi:hypothetical protein